MGSLTQLANLVQEFTALKRICDEEAKKELLELTQTLVVCACQSGNILEMDFEPFTTITPPKSLSHSIGNGLEFLTRSIIALTMFYDKEITKCLVDFLRHHNYKGKNPIGFASLDMIASRPSLKVYGFEVVNFVGDVITVYGALSCICWTLDFNAEERSVVTLNISILAFSVTLQMRSYNLVYFSFG
ncbi:hypothetical protein MTR67_051178 [Solanum verrucosum]|uniref:sucrose synthase n=1 Tax=Solanum verrucosum TaxID=315347 RepID=A0AAF0V6U2_SOLVR|nr:hypothetical protein MTR67_051178 [Solanum verrucosum]